MKTKLKTEVVLSAFILFTITIIYAMVLKPLLNDTSKFIIRPLIYILLLGVPFTLCRAMKTSIGNLGFKKDEILKQVLIGLGVFAALAAAITIIVLALGNNKGMLPAKENRIGVIIYSIIFDIVFVGMGEETLFRGYFMERFRALTGSEVWAVVISAIMFGVWHFPNGQDFLQVIITALIGAIFGFARFKVKNCSTLSVGIAHGLYDSFLLFLGYIL